MSVHVRKLWARKKPFKKGSVVVITGAASGIGRQVALAYAKRDCKLVLLDRDLEGAQATAKKCEASGAVTMTLGLDVTKEEAVGEAFEHLVDRFKTIDILILCAGVGAHHLFEDTKDTKIFRRLMDINFFGYLHCIKAAYPHLMSSKGVLVAITSFSAEVGLPLRSAYCASKFATTGLLESLRSEIAMGEKETGRKGFDITIVCPPTVDTNLRKNSMTPADKKGFSLKSQKSMTVEDCADAIMDATDRRLRKAFFPLKSWLAAYVRPLFPDLVDEAIRKRASL